MIRPWLLLPAETAHNLSSVFLSLYGRLHSPKQFNWSEWEWRGLKFHNRLGIAGGVDKDARHIHDWWTLGAGFLEVGTVTPEPQPGHQGHRFDRNFKQKAVWNRLGFPSQGVSNLAQTLSRLTRPYHTPLFINIGKNKDTPLDQAHTDYIFCMQKLSSFADAFIINISSPNTQGLRELLQPENLKKFLAPIVQAKNNTPLILKMSPDVSETELRSAIDVTSELDIDGYIFTNTSVRIRDNLNFPAEGGVSGLPLAECSKIMLKRALELLGHRRKGKLIISTGGVMTPEDVFERLALGADLVQVYAALIFSGPLFFKSVARAAKGNP